MIDECAGRVAKSMIGKRDAILKEAIDNRIGEGWSDHDLAGRLESQVTVSSGLERFFLDGNPIVEFYPAEPTHDYHDYSHYVGFNRRYRIFDEDAQP